MLWRKTALLNILKELITQKRVLILGFGREGRSTLHRLLQAGGYAALAIADQADISSAVKDPSIQILSGPSYLDALDDYDKDVKKHRYNVLYNAFGEKCKADAVAKNTEEITYIFDSLFADMRKNLANIKFRYNRDLTDNIILRGIPLKTRSLLKCDCRKKQGK